MRHSMLVAIVAVLLTTAAPAAVGTADLQGVWIAAPAETRWSRFTVSGDHVVIELADGRPPVHGFLEVDATTKPAALDLVLEHAGRLAGIFDVAGNSLALCLNARPDAKERPASMAARDGFACHDLARMPAIAQVAADEERSGPPPAAAPPPIELPKPTGALGIGRATFHLIDASRDEPNLDAPRRYRELLVHVSYPVERGAAGPPAPYFPALGLVSATLGEAAMKEDLEDAFPAVFTARGHAILGAAAAKTPDRFPIVLLVPGQGANSTEYTALVEDLVSHGYVVAGIEETFYASAVVFPGSRVVRLAAARWEKGLSGSYSQSVEFDGEICEMLARDVSFVLDQLEVLDGGAPNDLLAHRLDLGRVIVLGHSIGGRGAARAYQSDPRIRGCVSLDGFSPALDARGNFGGSYAIGPFMFLHPAFPMPPEDVLAQARMTERGFREWSERSFAVRKSFYRRGCRESWEVTFDVPGATHGAFTDLPLLSADRESGAVAQRERAMQIVRAYVLAFLDRVVGRGGGGLLDGASADFPEVDVQKFGPAAP